MLSPTSTRPRPQGSPPRSLPPRSSPRGSAAGRRAEGAAGASGASAPGRDARPAARRVVVRGADRAPAGQEDQEEREGEGQEAGHQRPPTARNPFSSFFSAPSTKISLRSKQPGASRRYPATAWASGMDSATASPASVWMIDPVGWGAGGQEGRIGLAGMSMADR